MATTPKTTDFYLDFSLGWEGKAYFPSREQLNAAINLIQNSDYISAIQSADHIDDLMDIGWSALAHGEDITHVNQQEAG